MSPPTFPAAVTAESDAACSSPAAFTSAKTSDDAARRVQIVRAILNIL